MFHHIQRHFHQSILRENRKPKRVVFQSCRCFVDCHLVFQLVLCRLTEHTSRAKMDNFQLAKKPDNCLLMDIVLLGNINTYLLQKVSVEAHIELSI